MADNSFESILSMISSNPEIMAKISDIAKSSKGDDVSSKLPEVINIISPLVNGQNSSNQEAKEIEKSDTPTIKVEDSPEKPVNLGFNAINNLSSSISKNAKLLLALKPYLSKERGEIIESVIKMSQVADLMKLAK